MEINVKDLRIGNWLYYWNQVMISKDSGADIYGEVQVCELYENTYKLKDDKVVFDPHDVMAVFGIDLTPEILKKAGFQAETFDGHTYWAREDTKNSFLLLEEKNDKGIYFFTISFYTIEQTHLLISLWNVHSLQNLYRQLTEKELEFIF